VSEIRSQLDEQNSDSVDDNADILPSLNRGLDLGGNILARRYPEPFLATANIDLLSGIQEYDMPEQAFEDRVLRAEIAIDGSYEEVRRVSYQEATWIESSATSDIPSAYLIVGRKLRFLPTPTGIHNARIWYMRNPEQLVLPQGRITVYSPNDMELVVDSIGTDLSTEVDSLNSYVNIVDAQTGTIKRTLQIQTIDENNTITFRSSPLRSSVLNRTISGSMSSDVDLDDLVCSIRGTCVLEYAQPLRNFLIQFAVAEITRKLGADAPLESEILAKFEKALNVSNSGRETTRRVQRRSTSWAGRPTRRIIIPRNS